MLCKGRLIHVNKVVCVDFLCNDVVAQEVGSGTYIASVKDLLFPLLSLEKFVNFLCSFEQAQLGFLINTHTIMVALTKDKMSKLQALLTN